MLARLRMVIREDLSQPDCDLDASGELLASMNNSIKSVTWEQVKLAVAKDREMLQLVDWIEGGCMGNKEDLSALVQEYWGIRDYLHVCTGVPMYGERTIVPRGLRQAVLATLHSAHQGVTGMTLRAGTSVYWPGITADIWIARDRCMSCHRTAPTQSRLPPVTPVVPQYPFEHICMDYMTLDGQNYGVFVDRFTNWPGVYHGSAAADVVKVLARLSEDYGVPVTCTTDGGPQYTAEVVRKFMEDYGIHHRLCSVANPHANTRAELAVKTVKRMIRDCRGIGGKLDSVKFSRALLQYRNTPDRDTKMSPASALFGRSLRDFLPRSPGALIGTMWREIADAREKALMPRAKGAHEKWSASSKELPPLSVGEDVMVQNQRGNTPRRWDKRGVVVQVLGYDQYKVMVAGSRKLTLRNRKYLRKYNKYQPAPFNVIAADVEPKQDDQKQDRLVLHKSHDGGVEVDGAPSGCPAIAQEPVVVGGAAGAGSHGGEDLVGNHEGQHDGNDQEPVGAQLQPEVSPVRRSSRVTKGITSRYNDFVPE